ADALEQSYRAPEAMNWHAWDIAGAVERSTSASRASLPVVDPSQYPSKRGVFSRRTAAIGLAGLAGVLALSSSVVWFLHPSIIDQVTAPKKAHIMPTTPTLTSTKPATLGTTLHIYRGH